MRIMEARFIFIYFLLPIRRINRRNIFFKIECMCNAMCNVMYVISRFFDDLISPFLLRSVRLIRKSDKTPKIFVGKIFLGFCRLSHLTRAEVINILRKIILGFVCRL